MLIAWPSIHSKRRTDMLLTGGALYPVVAKPDVAMGDMLVGRSLFMFPPRNRIRRFFARVRGSERACNPCCTAVCM